MTDGQLLASLARLQAETTTLAALLRERMVTPGSAFTRLEAIQRAYVNLADKVDPTEQGDNARLRALLYLARHVLVCLESDQEDVMRRLGRPTAKG